MVNSAAKRTLFSRFLVRLAAVAAVLALALTVQSSSSESVRFAAEPRPGESVQAELVRLQQQTGLSLATFGFGFNIVLFDKRSLVQIPISSGTALVTGSVSQDGTKIIVKRFDPSASDSLELLRTNGGYEREFPLTHGSEMRSGVESLCWSYDESKLAMGVHRGSPEVKLEILDLNSGADARVASGVKRLSSQCWSPDGKSIVYESGDGVRTYEVKNEKSSALLAPGGKAPTWSPDGNWIAFREGDTFYEIRPDGRDKKKLFHRKDVYSPLWWSPDSHFVAYVSLARFALDDVYELRVRKLADEVEGRIAEGQISGDYQWLISPQLARQAGSETNLH